MAHNTIVDDLHNTTAARICPLCGSDQVARQRNTNLDGSLRARCEYCDAVMSLMRSSQGGILARATDKRTGENMGYEWAEDAERPESCRWALQKTEETEETEA